MAQWKVDFNNLDLGERIGKGNFGEVYKGTYLGTDVAIKKLFFVDDDFMQKYIEREMDTLTYALSESYPARTIVVIVPFCTLFFLKWSVASQHRPTHGSLHRNG